MHRAIRVWPTFREAEDIQKRWQEYREELYKKELPNQDNPEGVITHLEPDILECEVKWALGGITTNKPSRGEGIPVELFQNLKDDAVKVLHAICQQIWKTQQWQQDWKRSVFIPIPKKGNANECSKYCTIKLISHTSKVMLKVLQTKLQQYMNRELPDVQSGFRKGRGSRNQIANIRWIIKKAGEFQKNIWKFMVHIVLKPGLENFEHYFTNCEMSAIVRSFEHSLALPFSGNGMKTDLFQSCGHC